MPPSRTSRSHQRVRILIGSSAAAVVGIVLTVALGAAPSADAQTAGPPSITRVTSGAGYKSMVVTFSEAVYTQYNSAATPPAPSGDLTASDFFLTDANGATVSTPAFTVAKEGTGLTSWKLDFGTNAFVPNGISVNVKPNEVFDISGQSAPAQRVAAPLVASRVDELLAGLKATEFPLDYEFDNGTTTDLEDDYKVSQLPFIGDWLSSTRSATAIVDGLAGVSNQSSQGELEAALEALDAISDVTFDGDGMQVTFTADPTPPTPTMSGQVGFDQVGLSSSISTPAAVTLQGSLTYNATGTAAVIETGSDALTLKIDASKTLTDLAANLGFAEATIDSSVLGFKPTFGLDLSCVTGTSTSCAPDGLKAGKPTIGGTGSWDLDSLSVTSGLGKTTFDPAAGVLDVDFNLSNTFDNQNTFVTLDTTSFKAIGLDGFNRVSMTSVLSGLGWFSTWLTEIEGHGAMGAEVPLIGGSVGEHAKVAGELAETVAGLSQEIEEYSTKDVVAPIGEADHPYISAQQAMKLLCESDLASAPTGGTCATLLEPFKLVLDSNENLKGIEYGIDVQLDHTFFSDTEAPVLDLGEEGSGLDGITLSMDPGGWDGEASSTLAFKLGIKTGTDSEVATELGLTSQDFDGDGVANAQDWDADGDGSDDSATDSLSDASNDPSNEGADRDDDADGMPEDYTLAEGDRCNGLFNVVNSGLTTSIAQKDFAKANDVWITDTDLASAGNQEGLDAAKCDKLAKTGTSIKTTVGGTGTALTAAQVCAAGASVSGLGDSLPTFRSLNNFASDSACATAIATADAGSRFDYDRNGKAFGSPVTIGHRIYVDTGKLADVALDVTGEGLTAAANLGFLDLTVTSLDTIDGQYGVKLDPSFEVNLVDPGTGAADSKIDLMEMAEAADKRTMKSLVSFAVTGKAEAHFDLDNGVLETKQLDVIGDFSAIDNAFTNPSTPMFNFRSNRLESSSATGYMSDRINVGHNLGDYLELKNLTAADALQILSNLSDQISKMAGDEVLALEIPFTGTTLADAVQFSKTFADIAAAVESADPQSLSAFEDALSSALKAAGMPGEITPHVTADSLSFSFDASRTTEAVYPFSINPSDYGIPEGIPFLPSDGGASVAMTAGMEFTPELGILFEGDAVADRIFVKNFVPKFTASLDGTTHGTINIGPFATTLDGNLTVADAGDDEELGTGDDAPAAVTVSLTDPTPTTEMTIEDLEVILADFEENSSLDIIGAFDAGLNVAQPAGGMSASGTLEDLFKRNFSAIESEASIDFSSISLNLDSFVTGTTQTARWIGALMKQSRSYSAEIPLVGDKLTKLADVDAAMTGMADAVDEAWADAKGKANAFKNNLETEIETQIEAAFPSDVPVEVTADAIWTDKDGDYPINRSGVHDPDYEGDEAEFGVAGGLVVKLHIGLKDTKTTALPGGLNVPPVLELDADISPEVTYGFNVDMGLGVSVNDGFYVVGADDGALLDAFAKLDTAINVNKVAVGGANIAKIAGGTAEISGDVGPGDTDAAGIEIAIVPAPGADSSAVPQISLADIVGKKKRADQPVDARFSIDADIDLPLATTFPKIPNLLLPVHFNWEAAGSVSGGAEIGQPSLAIGSGNDLDDDQIELDAKELLREVIAPTLETANDYNPFAKVPMIKTTIDSNVPVLESSMRKIARQFMGPHPAWSMFEFLIDLDKVAADVKLAGSALSGNIKLGWVEVAGDANGDGKAATGRHPYPEAWYDQGGFGPLVTALENLISSAGGGGKLKRATNTSLPAPTTGGSTVSSADNNTTNPVTPVTTQPTTSAGPCPTSAKPPAPAGATTSPRVGRNIGKYGCLFSFPIMDDPMSAIGMVLQGDMSETVSFFEFRPPPINVGPSIAWSKTLFDLNSGIIDGSLTVGFDGALGLTARLGFGFDSSGLVQGRFPLDGFYLIDYKDPDSGRDLNEVEIGGRVAGFIDGRFSVLGGVASAAFEGAAGVNATAGLDFNDESEAILPEDRNDGRFHFREIEQVAQAAYDQSGSLLKMVLCPMRPSADLSAFLSIHGVAKALGVTVFDESYSEEWDLLSIMGIPKTVNCPPPDRIAQTIDGQLVLNGGPNAANRLNGGTDIAEKYSITQSGDDVTVSWTGTPNMTPSSLTFDIAEDNISEIVADLGSGDDSVVLANSVTLPVTLSGGPGADSFTGGAAADQLDGGPGSDNLNGGAADDTLLGGTGNDTLTGAAGDDDLQGGDSTNETSDDTYNFSGAWGNDVVEDPDGQEKFVFTTSAGLTGTSEFADASITDGTNTVSYFIDEIDNIQSGSGSDDFTIKSQVPDGFLLNGNLGDDEIHVEYMGQDRTIELKGGGGTADVFHALGTPGPDLFLSRANSKSLETAATSGSLYMLADQFPEDETYNPDDDLADRVKYNNTFESLQIQTLGDKDHVVMDDNAAPTRIDGGEGSDRFQIGQIFGDPASWVLTQETTRGQLSKGASYPTQINGNFENSDVPADPSEPYVAPTTYSDDDYFQVYSNQAELDLNGNEGDDTFVVRAFALAGTVTENATTIGEDVDLGGGVGADQFEYAQNKLVDIDGGRGFDTYVIVGTEFSDGFLVSKEGVKICKLGEFAGQALPDPTKCAVNTVYTNIEKVVGQGLEGSDVFQMLSTTDAASTSMFGGEDGDRFVVGDNGDVTDIKGPLTVRGEADPGFDSSIVDPTVLPGESTDGSTSQCSDGADNDTDGRTDHPADLQCYGNDDPREGVSVTQDDSMLVNAAAHATNDTGANDFDLAGGDPTGAVTGLGMWTGGELSSTATSGRSQSFDAGVVYGDLEFAAVQLGSGNDTFNINSTHPKTTTVRGGGGADQVNVRTVAGPTVVRGEAGNDTVDAGTTAPSSNGEVEGLDALLDVYGNDGNDSLFVDDSGEDGGQTVSSDQISEKPAGAAAAYTRGQLLGIGMSSAGIKYDTLELVDVELGSASDYIDARGTITNTVFHGNAGDERLYVSSDAALANHGTDFLTGNLDDVDGDLTFDAGDGRHQMMVSDEASSSGDGTAADPVAIDENSIQGLSDGDINYDTDAVTASASGDFADGITIWTSAGPDTASWTGSRYDAGVRTVTTVNTNGAADNFFANLSTADGSSVLNTESGADVVDASSSSLGLILFGGPGTDDLKTGSGADVVLGDDGLVTYAVAGATTTIHGNGSAAGDKTDGVSRSIATITSTGAGDPSLDGDTIDAGSSDDKVIAGNGVDRVAGGTGNDDIAGDGATFTAGLPLTWSSQRPQVSTSGAGDVLAGDGGADWILGQHGDDRILGGALVDAAQMDVVDTTDGDDILIGDHDAALGLAGDDRLAGDNGNDLVLADNAQRERGTSTTLLDVQQEASVIARTFRLTSSGVVPATAHGDDVVYGNDDRDRIYAQGGSDAVDGGAQDDYIEGNHGEDTIFGGPHNDDIIGGSSSVSGLIGPTTTAAGPLDGTDHLFGDSSDAGVSSGNDGHDVILGDNGHIERDGRVLDATLYPDHPLRQVAMADGLPGDTSGGDEIRGNGGNDQLYGQLDANGDSRDTALTAGCTSSTVTTLGDVLCGDAGQDALVGDRGRVVVRTSESQGAKVNSRIRSSSPFIDETIFKPGDLFYVTTVETPVVGGADLIHGGAARDSIHAGASADLVNGATGDDAIFGAHGDDDLWGGVGHDRIYGGHGADEIDIKPLAKSPASWSVVAPSEDRDGDRLTVNGGDLIYGGWDADILQADTGDAGKVFGDRMIDWTGSYNLFYVCNGAYGAGRVQREFSPDMLSRIQQLAVADGSTSTTAKSATGDDELGLVNSTYVKANTSPRHPLWPGNFTCES